MKKLCLAVLLATSFITINAKEKKHFLQLPREVQAGVCSYLDPIDIINVADTCKDLNRAVYYLATKNIKKNYVTKGILDVVSCKKTRTIKLNEKNLKEILQTCRVKNHEKLTDKDFYALCDYYAENRDDLTLLIAIETAKNANESSLKKIKKMSVFYTLFPIMTNFIQEKIKNKKIDKLMSDLHGESKNFYLKKMIITFILDKNNYFGAIKNHSKATWNDGFISTCYAGGSNAIELKKRDSKHFVLSSSLNGAMKLEFIPFLIWILNNLEIGVTTFSELAFEAVSKPYPLFKVIMDAAKNSNHKTETSITPSYSFLGNMLMPFLTISYGKALRKAIHKLVELKKIKLLAQQASINTLKYSLSEIKQIETYIDDLKKQQQQILIYRLNDTDIFYQKEYQAPYLSCNWFHQIDPKKKDEIEQKLTEIKNILIEILEEKQKNKK